MVVPAAGLADVRLQSSGDVVAAAAANRVRRRKLRRDTGGGVVKWVCITRVILVVGG
jgi:hypothetical protein